MELVDLLIGTTASLLARTDTPTRSRVLLSVGTVDWEQIGMVIADQTPWPSPSVRTEALETARSRGIPIVEYSPQEAGPVTAPGAITPSGLTGGSTDVVIARSTAPGWEPSGGSLRALATRFGLSQLPNLVDLGVPAFGDPAPAADVEAFFVDHGHQSMVLLSEALFPSHVSAAATCLTLSLRGIPVLVDPSPRLASLLSPSYLEVVSPDLYTDIPIERELLSSVQRVVAHRDHGGRAASWRLRGNDSRSYWPSVSILAPTNRPGMGTHLAEQLTRQTYENVEIVLIAHGDEFPTAAVDELTSRLGDRDLKVIKAPSRLNLGEVLNRGAAICEGSYILKWDDDDYYSPGHIWDLVVAANYSGAQITAKGAEFVHLELLDTTMRRFLTGQERENNTVAGGTLLVDRNAFRRAGGFPRSRAAVDAGLLASMRSVGGSIYRTHGFGYVLSRATEGHTWDPGVDYFLNQSAEQWKGLDLDVAGIFPLRPRRTTG